MLILALQCNLLCLSKRVSMLFLLLFICAVFVFVLIHVHCNYYNQNNRGFVKLNLQCMGSVLLLDVNQSLSEGE
jgi:hypothetical protein